MENKFSQKLEKEQKVIIKYIFKGFSNSEIARIMHYSRSTISYRINLLFEKYCVSSRHELILAILAQLSAKNKEIIKKQVEIIGTRNEELLRYRSLLKDIVVNFDKRSKLTRAICRAKTLLNEQ